MDADGFITARIWSDESRRAMKGVSEKPELEGTSAWWWQRGLNRQARGPCTRALGESDHRAWARWSLWKLHRLDLEPLDRIDPTVEAARRGRKGWAG